MNSEEWLLGRIGEHGNVKWCLHVTQADLLDDLVEPGEADWNWTLYVGDSSGYLTIWDEGYWPAPTGDAKAAAETILDAFPFGPGALEYIDHDYVDDLDLDELKYAVHDWSLVPEAPAASMGSNLGRVVVLDTETTGLSKSTDEILQVSMVDWTGRTLLNTYVRPVQHDEWPAAQAIHGITPEMVADAPTMADLKARIETILYGAQTIMGYNVGFDLDFLRRDVDIDPEIRIIDVMKSYAPVQGKWNSRRQEFIWPKLSECAEHYGVLFGAHDSLEDAKATLACWKAMQKDPEYLDAAGLELKRAKMLIRDFYREEYGTEPDFSRLSRISLAHTILDDGAVHELSAYADLLDPALVTEIDGVFAEKLVYADLDALISAQLKWLDFDALTQETGKMRTAYLAATGTPLFPDAEKERAARRDAAERWDNGGRDEVPAAYTFMADSFFSRPPAEEDVLGAKRAEQDKVIARESTPRETGKQTEERNEMEKTEYVVPEPEQTKKLYLELPSAYVAQRMTGDGKVFYSIKLPEGTEIGGEDVTGWALTQNKVFPSKYRDGFLVASFPNPEWKIKLTKRTPNGEGGWNSAGREVAAGELMEAVEESRKHWEEAYRAERAALNHPGPKTLQEIFDSYMPEAKYKVDGDPDVPRLQACLQALKDNQIVKEWTHQAIILIATINGIGTNDEIKASFASWADAQELRNRIAVKMLNDLTPAEAVRYARCADKIDEIGTLIEARHTVLRNEELAQEFERAAERGQIPEQRQMEMKLTAERIRQSTELVTTKTIAEWCGIDSVAKGISYKKPAATKEKARAAV